MKLSVPSIISYILLGIANLVAALGLWDMFDSGNKAGLGAFLFGFMIIPLVIPALVLGFSNLKRTWGMYVCPVLLILHSIYLVIKG